MTRRSAVFAAFLLVSLAVPLVAGPKPRPDRVKVMIGWADGRRAPIPVDARGLGGEEVADYGRYRLLSVPPAALIGLEHKLQAQNLRLTRRDDFDELALPGGRIDVRRGLDPSIPGTELIRAYPHGVRGLHVVQFHGPTLREWMDALVAAGAKVVNAVPQNGQLILATAGEAAAIEALTFVQWVSPFHPHHKAKPSKRAAEAQAVEIEIVTDEGGAETIERLRRADPAASEFARLRGRVLYKANLDGRALDELLADPFVVGVFDTPQEALSAERSTMATSSNLNVDGTQPTNPTTYKNWIASNCAYCGDLAASGFWVGIADTGLDSGSTGTRHADLTNTPGSSTTRMRFGFNFSSQTSTNADHVAHGTMVAGIIAGRGANATARDRAGSGAAGTGFHMGTGLLPTAGIFSTKIGNASGVITTSTGVLQWAADATSNNVFIQNHSNNDYSASNQGKYTTRSAQYDAAVRDSNGAATAGGLPITLTVSSGNRDLNATGPLTLAPATGKNVIAVGGAENWRDNASELAFNCRGTTAGGFKNLMSWAKHGTVVSSIAPDGSGLSHAWSTYMKPDLVAPASMIIAPRGPVFTTVYCVPTMYSQPYTMESGTSFAAPVAAAASALAARVYSQKVLGVADADAASPALRKAMLIASARSMAGGIDRANGQTIPERPSIEQGFGLISTVEMLDATPRTFFNQAHRFYSSDEGSYNMILTRRDMTRRIKAALVWTDAPAEANATEPLQNNLDFSIAVPSRQFNPDGGPMSPCPISYLGNNPSGSDTTFEIHCMMMFTGVGPDMRNNAELIVVPQNPSRSSVFVTVNPTAINAVADPADPWGNNQDFAFYVYNATQRGDFDHDGKAEILWRHTGTETRPKLWHNLSGTSFTWLDALPQPWRIEAVADFDSNGSDDYVIYHPTTGEVQIRLMNKTATLSTTATVGTMPLNWDIGGAGDMDHDGYIDIVWRNLASGADAGKLKVWRMNDTTIHEVVDVTSAEADLNFKLEGVSDLGFDGNVDLVYHNRSTGAVKIVKYERFTHIGHTLSPQTAPGSVWRLGGFGDYNQDGYNDIVWRKKDGGINQIWYGGGWGVFTVANIGAEADAAWTIAGPR
jgi:Subtilase family